MKNLCPFFLLTLGLITYFDNISYCYDIIQLTDNASLVSDLNSSHMSDSYVVWEEYDGNDNEIFLYNGSATIQITDNDDYDTCPTVNENGYVAWHGPGTTGEEIFLYNGSNILQLTNSNDEFIERSPKINNQGHVVWVNSLFNLFLYNGTTVTQLNRDGFGADEPDINDSGDVVWQEYDGNDYEIFLYNGSATIQLTDNDYRDVLPKINNYGHVVWQGSIGTGDEQDDEVDSLVNLYFYNGSNTALLTDSYLSINGFDINDTDEIVWAACDCTNSDLSYLEIFLYDGFTITQLTNNHYGNQFPKINNNGHVVWESFDPVDHSYTDHEIFVYDGSTVTQLTDDEAYRESMPQISENNSIVWTRYSGSQTGEGVMLAIPHSHDASNTGGCFISSIN